jgi:putative thioredoxin
MAAKTFGTETTVETFDRDVFEASEHKIVILDFYADWCQPCRMLAPVLKDVVEARQEQFALVKANTEQLQDQASAFSVQSIPVLFAISNKSVIDRVEGLLTQAQLNQWLDSLVIQQRFVQAYALEDTDPQAALKVYQEIAGLGNVADELKIAIMRAAYKAGDLETTTRIMTELERRGFLEPEAEKIKAQLKLVHSNSADIDSLKKTVEQSPSDFGTRLELAKALVATRDYEGALQQALHIVQLDRQQTRKAAQELMVDIFRILPEGDELIGNYRRKLAMAMY